MGTFLAELSARFRFSVRLTLAEADALTHVAGQHRGSRDLSSAVRRIQMAADRKRASLNRRAAR